jgi:hypothetical protein
MICNYEFLRKIEKLNVKIYDKEVIYGFKNY